MPGGLLTNNDRARNQYNMYADTVDPNDDIRGLVAAENTRIADKKGLIDSEYTTKERKDLLFKSLTARDEAYNKIIMVLSIVVIVVGGSIYLNKIRPSIAFDLLIIIAVGGGIIYLALLTIEYARRDKLEFNKINSDILAKPPKRNVNDGKTTIGNVTSLDGINLDMTIGTNSGCYGDSCCPADAIFVDNKCIKKEGFVGTIEPFTINPKFNLI